MPKTGFSGDFRHTFCVKNKEILGKSPMKICKYGNFRSFSGIFGRKRIFLKNDLVHVLSIANAHLFGKNQKKLMMKSRENAKKPVFPAYFRHFWPEMNFSGNRAPSHFGHCHFASLCQKISKN